MKTNAIKALALLGLLLKLSFPPGYMPGDISQGQWITICPQGLPAGVLGQSDDGHHQHGGDHPHQPDLQLAGDCPLGSQLSISAIVMSVGMLAINSQRQARHFDVFTVQVPRLRWPYQSRAPPSAA